MTPGPAMPIDPEAVAIGTGLGGIFGKVARAQTAPEDASIGGGNVLAHAARKAYDGLDFDDLDDVEGPMRAHFVQQNGARYEADAQEKTGEALRRANDSQAKAQGDALRLLPKLTPPAAHAQRVFVHDALGGISRAEQALRDSGASDIADRLGEIGDGLVDASTDHQEGLPLGHAPGDLLHTLNEAYETLKAADPMPPEAADVLAQLRTGSEKPELWGRAGDLLRDLREADDATSTGTDTGDFAAAMRQQLDVLDRYDIDTGDLQERLDDLDHALARGDQVAATKIAHSIDSDPTDMSSDAHPLNAIIKGAMAEAGVSGSTAVVTDQMPSSMAGLAREIGSSFFYDQALRATGASVDVQLKRAAREMTGQASPRQEVPADASNARFSAGYPDELAAFGARRGMLTAMQGDPSALIKALSNSYGDLAQTHPDVFAGLVEKAGTAAAILTEAMPPSVQKSLSAPNGVAPSVDDVRTFARTYTAVVEPEVFIGELGAGQAWPQQGEAFAKMYPNQWAKLAKDALDSATMRGPSLTPQQATYLDLMFDIGNNIGGMWSNSGAKSISGAIESAAKQKEQAGGKGPGQPPQQSMLAPELATMNLAGGPTMRAV